MSERWWWRVVGFAVVAGLLVGVVAGRRADLWALAGYQAIVIGIAVWLVIALRRHVRAAQPEPWPSPSTLRRHPSLRRMDDLESLVIAAAGEAGHAHYRMRRRLRSLAADGLARRHIDLDGEPERARAALGDEAYEWLRRDRPAPADRHAGGPGVVSWDRIVRAIERLDGDDS